MKQRQTQSILIQCKDWQFSSNQFFANKKKRQIKWNLSFTFLCELYLISVRRHFYKCISTLAPTHFLLLLLLITFFVYYNVDIIIVMKEKKGKNWQKNIAVKRHHFGPIQCAMWNEIISWQLVKSFNLNTVYLM